MSAKIIPKKSTVADKVPLASDLEPGEICINLTDGIVYGKHTDGSIVNLTGALELHTHTISQIAGLQTALDDANEIWVGSTAPTPSEYQFWLNTTDDSLQYHDGAAWVLISGSGGGISVFSSFAGFPATGESGKLYIANDTEYMYRWDGTSYVQLTSELFTPTEQTKLAGIESGAQVNTVTSVNTYTGDVSLLKADVGLGQVRNVASYSQTEADSTFASISHTHNYDNYGGWILNTDGVSRGNIASSEGVDFVGGTNVSLAYNATGNVITISSTDTNTDTTYTAGAGLTLTGTSFALTDESYTTTEKTKLSGIESGATADQTASEILTSIKTVDGSTSGLDADLLDGNHASAFQSTLVSGTNIKTLNGQSILGSGDLTLETGGTVTISDTPPTSPSAGDLWWDSSEGNSMYIYYNDGTSSQWVTTVAQLAGPKGNSGELSIGTVTTLANGEPATVTNTGTASDAILDFGLPKGDNPLDLVDVWQATTTDSVNRLYFAANSHTRIGTGGDIIMTNSTGGTIATFSSTGNITSSTIHGDTNTLTVDGTNEVGFRGLPINGEKTVSYSAVSSDRGKCITVGTGGSLTIPNSTFSPGDAFTVFNNTTADVTITCSTTTSYISGTDENKASVALATRGLATVFFVDGTTSVISGNVS